MRVYKPALENSDLRLVVLIEKGCEDLLESLKNALTELGQNIKKCDLFFLPQGDQWPLILKEVTLTGRYDGLFILSKREKGDQLTELSASARVPFVTMKSVDEGTRAVEEMLSICHFLDYVRHLGEA